MKIYIDSGNLDEIKNACETRLIDGVTTNPSLIAKENIPFEKILEKIIEIFKKNGDKNFTVSAEVTNTSSVENILIQARELSKISKNVIIKIPLTKTGLKAVKILSDEKIKTNVTLCFSANQALLAAKAGAYIISPFIGRIDDQGWDGLELIKDIKTIYANYGFETKILAASIRSTNHVFLCAKAGADIVTIPYEIFDKMYYNPLTDIGIEKFDKDWEKYLQKIKH